MLFVNDTVLVTEAEDDLKHNIPRSSETAHISSQLGNCRSHLLAQTNTLKPQRHNTIYLLCQFLPLHRAQLQDRRGFGGHLVLTMKVLVVLHGLITATLLSGKSGAREEGRESWDKE